ncbi:hypothetical protein B0H11DRAFT_2081939 [Mycena galericulata]|nr:hypothetical protein B0H11DRAFT_2081939 [Mycena galericulata]
MAVFQVPHPSSPPESNLQRDVDSNSRSITTRNTLIVDRNRTLSMTDHNNFYAATSDSSFGTGGTLIQRRSTPVGVASAVRGNTTGIALPIILGLGICLVIAAGIALAVYLRRRRQIQRAKLEAAARATATANEDAGIGLDGNVDEEGTRSPPASLLRPDPIPEADADPPDNSNTTTLLNA